MSLIVKIMRDPGVLDDGSQPHSLFSDVVDIHFPEANASDGQIIAKLYIREPVKTAMVPGFCEIEKNVHISGATYVMNDAGKTISTYIPTFHPPGKSPVFLNENRRYVSQGALTGRQLHQELEVDSDTHGLQWGLVSGLLRIDEGDVRCFEVHPGDRFYTTPQIKAAALPVFTLPTELAAPVYKLSIDAATPEEKDEVRRYMREQCIDPVVPPTGDPSADRADPRVDEDALGHLPYGLAASIRRIAEGRAQEGDRTDVRKALDRVKVAVDA